MVAFLPVLSLSLAHLLQGEKVSIVSSASFKQDLLTLGSPNLLFPGSNQFGGLRKDLRTLKEPNRPNPKAQVAHMGQNQYYHQGPGKSKDPECKDPQNTHPWRRKVHTRSRVETQLVMIHIIK